MNDLRAPSAGFAILYERMAVQPAIEQHGYPRASVFCVQFSSVPTLEGAIKDTMELPPPLSPYQQAIKAYKELPSATNLKAYEARLFALYEPASAAVGVMLCFTKTDADRLIAQEGFETPDLDDYM